jgi:hypothetical protein
MAVSEAEVHELRRDGEARGLDDVDTTLQSYAEILGYVVHEARSHGWDVNDYVELLVRATDLPREDIRQARDVLQALGYPPELMKLLTALARKAKPKPPSWIERRRAAEAVR